MDRPNDNMAALVASLSPRQRAALLQTLLAGQGLGRQPDSDRLQAIENRLWKQAQAAPTPGRIHASGRLWLVFMLLRHGGMRLKEIFKLTEADCAFGEGIVRAGKRTVLFAPAVAARLAGFWADWPGRVSGKNPLACDASLIRRSLSRIGRACGCEGLNARFLRRQRERELADGGLHPGLVAWFMDGRSAMLDERAAEAATRQFLARENAMKTSARNVFPGMVSEITENGILTSVRIQTADKLGVTAIITNTSRKNLNLAPGVAVTALVKAPWVSVMPVGERAEASAGNCFQGKVETINRDQLACEIHVALDKGPKICSLYANGAWPSAGIETGLSVLVSFSPFSVILTES